MATIAKDFKIGLRTMWRSPGYSGVAILTLALAIGANTLLFSIANPLVVRALPIKDPDRLGWVAMSHAERGVTRGSASMPDYLEWRDGLKSFTSLAAYSVRQSTLTGHGDAARIFVASATTNLVDVWGLAPTAGRLFNPGEDKAGAARPAVLSFRYWRESFQSDPTAIGRSFFVDGTPVTVVGVMQQSIELGTLSLIDIWVPATLDGDNWVHVRVVVQRPAVRVYLDHATEPSLAVTELSERSGGQVGFFAVGGQPAYFANLRITRQP